MRSAGLFVVLPRRQVSPAKAGGMHVAWLVYQETGKAMPSDVNEAGEDSLDLLDEQRDQRG